MNSIRRFSVVVSALVVCASLARAQVVTPGLSARADRGAHQQMDRTVTIDFEQFPGPDGILGTVDDTFPACNTPGCTNLCPCESLNNQFAGIGLTFTSGLLLKGDLFPGSTSSNHFVSSSPPDATFSIPVTGISITSYSFWTATLYALDDANNVIASNTLTNPNAGSAFLLGTLSVSTSTPIRRFTVLAAGCQIGAGMCNQILNLDNLVLTFPSTNPPAAAGIPTLTGWGMLAFLTLLGVGGAFLVGRGPVAGA